MPDEKVHDTESLQKTRWASLIEDIRHWPAEAQEWEIVQAFTDQVQLVASQKHQERDEAGRIQRLQQELTQLWKNHESDLAFFNFNDSDLSNWQANHCPIDQVPEQTERVKDLLAQLARRQNLNQQVVKNYQEACQQREDLGTVEARISSLMDQLNRAFSVPGPPQTLDEDAEEEDHPPEPPNPGEGPSGEPSDSDQDQETEEDTNPPEEIPQEESSPYEEETASQPREPKPTPIQTQPPEPSPPDEEPTVKGTPLRSAREVAVLLQKDNLDEHWESLGWALLAEGDWAGAYWLARSLTAAGRPILVAPELLAVLQGSRWLTSDTDGLVGDIQDLASKWAPGNTTPERLLGLAAALHPTLIIAPHAGLVDWLPQRDEINPALGILADAVRTFAKFGRPLRAEDLLEDLLGIEGTATRTTTIEEIVEQASSFLKNAPGRRMNFQPATRVLQNLVAQDGDLCLLLTPVTKNQADQVDQVRQCMCAFKDRQQIVEHIHQINPRRRPITGTALNQLVRNVEEAVSLADRWCSLIEKEQDIRNRGDRWSDPVEKLLCQIQGVLPGIGAELNRMQAENQPQEEAALGRVLQQAIGQVKGTLGLGEQLNLEGTEAWMRSGGSLKEALARRLLWIPEIPLDEDGHPEKDHEADIAKVLCRALIENRSPTDAFSLRIDGQDFRFTDLLLDVLEDEEVRQECEHQNNNALKGARAALADQVTKVQGAIEQGVVDGLLFEEERTERSAELETVAMKELLYFRPLFELLGNIEQQLEQRYADRLQELDQQWKKIRQDLEQSPHADHLEAVEAFIQRAFKQRDTWVVNESLSHLGEVLQGASEWKSEWFTLSDECDVFEEFRKACPDIEALLNHSKSVGELATEIEKQI